ncbi:uncharacterized protein LOC111519419 [Drosophila willistoni]|uniref:uncharacterized protein LOC111519419 n=1 Tax=Drosophila willistoni TaxID=7260 RepID=UPI00017D944E|nr:uncharacterized protein LOC111519419 [Drosophila willistoni]
MPVKRLAFNKKTSGLTKKTPGLDGIGSHNNKPSEEFDYPLTESISNLIHQQVTSIMMSKDFHRDVAREMKRLDEPQEAVRSCDAEYVRMEDLKRAVNEIISRDSIQKVLDNNAKLFADALLNLKKRLYTVEAKLETLQSRMSDVEQLVHERHNSHIKQVVRTMMKEFAQDTIPPRPSPQRKRQSSEPSKSPARMLFKRPADSEYFRRFDYSEELPIQHEKSIPIKKVKHLKLPEGKFPKICHKISRNAARFSASDSNLGAAARPSIVAPNVSSASLSVSLAPSRMKKQRTQSTSEQKRNETNDFPKKRSSFSNYSNDVGETFPIGLRRTNAATSIKNARAMEYQPHKILQIKAYKSKRT